MRKRLLPMTLLALALLVGCQAEREFANPDPDLLGYWTFQGFTDSLNQPIKLPAFDPDTIPYYEVNLLVGWNALNETYIFQGQAPHDIYWGEYGMVDGNGLRPYGLFTTGLTPPCTARRAHARDFLTALEAARGYQVNPIDTTLILLYGASGHRMHFTLRDEQVVNSPTYLRAQVNGMSWSADPRLYGAIVNATSASSFSFSLVGISPIRLENDMAYSIRFDILAPPAKGIYTFNNQGLTVSPDGGVIGMCQGTDLLGAVTKAFTTQGAIGITLINRSFVKGHFSFRAQGLDANADSVYLVENGEFLVNLDSPVSWMKPF